MPKPTDVGDLIEWVWTITPPAHAPAAVVTAVTVRIRKPDGTEVAGTATNLSPNVWLCSATARCDVAGLWVARANANAGMILSFEEPVKILRSKFVTPLP